METQKSTKSIENVVADRILDLRTITNLTQEELADKLDISSQTVSNWERGTRLPQSYDILKICQIFGLSFEYIMGLTNIPYIDDLTIQHFTIKKAHNIRIIDDIVLYRQKATLYLHLDTHILRCLALEELLSIYSGENATTEPILINELRQTFPTNKEYIEIPILSFYMD